MDNEMILMSRGATLTIAWGRSISYGGDKGNDFCYGWKQLERDALAEIRECPIWNEPDTMLSYDVLLQMIKKYDERLDSTASTL